MKFLSIMTLCAVLAGGAFFAKANTESSFFAKKADGNRSVLNIEQWGQALYDSIKKESIPSYKAVMAELIHIANVTGVLHVLFPPAKKQNIFHIMASVKNPEAQEFFAQEMDSLIHILKGNPYTVRSLGGATINFPNVFDFIPPDMPRYAPGVQFASFTSVNDFSQPAITALRDEWIQRKNGSFIDFIRFLYARHGADSVADILSEGFVRPPIGPVEELLDNVAQVSESLKEKRGEVSRRVRFTANNSPIDIARKTGNAPAFRVLESAKAKSSADNFNASALGFALGFFGYGIAFTDYYSSAGWFLLSAAGAGIASAVAANLCSRAVRWRRGDRLRENRSSNRGEGQGSLYPGQKPAVALD